jgi:hypothetical protein
MQTEEKKTSKVGAWFGLYALGPPAIIPIYFA